jgi:hypothetical protein
VELVGGTGLFFVSWLSFMRTGTAAGSLILLENWFPGLMNTHFMGVGLLSGIAWFLHPLAWLFGSIMVTGFVRVIAASAAGASVGEPLVWLALRGYQGVRRLRARRRRARSLGPARPDRLKHLAPGRLLLLTCRERTEWNPSVTIEVNGHYYRLADVEERSEGDWTTLAYHLREERENEIFRRLVHYERVAAE